MPSLPVMTAIVAGALLAACRDRAPERAPDGARLRATAERVAQDTARLAWRHAVGVDSVRMRGDTTVVWVSPRDWVGTDAPQAAVSVSPDGRVASVHWVLGG